MTYRVAIWRLCLSRTLYLARAARKGKLLEWLWLCAECAAIASACVRVDVLRDCLPRGAVACEAPAGRGNSVGFRRNCC